MMQTKTLSKKQKIAASIGVLILLFGGMWLAFGHEKNKPAAIQQPESSSIQNTEETKPTDIPAQEPARPTSGARTSTQTAPRDGQPYVQPSSGSTSVQPAPSPRPSSGSGVSSAQPVTNQGTPTVAPQPGVSPAQPVTNQPQPTIAQPAPQPGAGASTGGSITVRPQAGPGNLQPTVQQNNTTYPQFQPEYEVAHFTYSGGSPFYCTNNPCEYSFRSNGKYYVNGILRTTLSQEKINVITNHVNQTSYASIRQRPAPTVTILSPSYGCSQQSGKMVFTFTLANQQTEVIDACQHQISNAEEPFKSLEYIRSVFP